MVHTKHFFPPPYCAIIIGASFRETGSWRNNKEENCVQRETFFSFRPVEKIVVPGRRGTRPLFQHPLPPLLLSDFFHMLSSRLNPLRRFRGSASSSSSAAAAIPRVTLVLGGGGLLPFLWYGTQHAAYNKKAPPVPWGDEVLHRWEGHTGLPLTYFACGDQATVRHRFTSYSASILSFLGAVHWGAAMCGPAATGLVATQYIFSVMPSLLAWGALCAPEDWGGSRAGTARHTLLAGGFLASYFFDEMCASRKPVPALPPFYTYLRAPLTCAVVVLHCIAGAMARPPSVSDVEKS